MLNAVFDAQTEAIVGRSGEMLKIIGDGLLSIFPVEAADAAAAASRHARTAQAVER